MKKLCAAMFLVFASLFIARGQEAPLSLSLFTVQCKAGEAACYTQEIVRYNFKDGEFVSKEILLSLPTDDVRFDLGGNSIYQNRYVIGRSGSIFDVQTKQLLGDNRGQLVDVVGSNVIFGVSHVDMEGLFSLNLETEKYQKLPSPNVFESKGKLSPNKKRFANWRDTNLSESEFQFHEVENWKSIKTKAVKGSYYASCSIRCSSGMRVPFVWIDDERIITQKSNGDIVSINVKGKVEQIVKIKIDETPDSLPFFVKDKFGNISYDCDGATYSIDIKNKTYTKGKSILGNDFERITGKVFWSEYSYKGKSIGRIWSSSPLSYKGFLVIDYAKEGQNLGSVDGIKILNDIKKDWTTIEVNWGVKIIGWIEG